MEFLSRLSFQNFADGTLAISNAPGGYILWICAFLFVMPVSYLLWKRDILGHYAAGFFFASFCVPLIVLPGLAMESITISKTELRTKTGLWFAPTEKTYSLVGLKTIQETSVKRNQRVVSRNDLIWVFEWNSGEKRRLSLSDQLSGCRKEVAEYLQKSGIRVDLLPDI